MAKPKTTTFQSQAEGETDRRTNREKESPSRQSNKSNRNSSDLFSGAKMDQELKEQGERLMERIFKEHEKKSQAAATAFGNEIDNTWKTCQAEAEGLSKFAENHWDHGMISIKKSTFSTVDAKDISEGFEEDRKKISKNFTSLEERAGLARQNDDEDILERLPLVYQDRPKRLKAFRRKTVAAFKREEEEIIEYKKTSNGAKLLTQAVKKSFK